MHRPVAKDRPWLSTSFFFFKVKNVETFSLTFMPLIFRPIAAVTYLHYSGFRIFKKLLYQGGVKSTFSWVFEDLKFKISEGYDQNWCFPDPAHLAVSV